MKLSRRLLCSGSLALVVASTTWAADTPLADGIQPVDLGVFEKQIADADDEMIEFLAEYADTHALAGSYKKAALLYRKQIGLLEMRDGVEAKSLAEPLEKLAAITSGSGRHALLKRRLAIMERYAEEDPRAYGVELVQYGDILMVEAGYQKARSAYERVWEFAASTDAVDAAGWFSQPTLISYYAPSSPDDNVYYYAIAEFSVRNTGDVQSIRLPDHNLKYSELTALRESVKRAIYRPRMIDGRTVDTAGVRLRTVWEPETE